MQPIPFAVMRSSLAIHGEYVLPDGYQPGQRCPAAFFCHCFGGNYDTMVKYAAPFAEKGYAVFRFDFCGGCNVGRSGGDQLDMCFATECADLCAVIDYALTLPYVDREHLALIGESMGGVIAAMTAAKNRYPVEHLVMISPAFCAPDDARKGEFGGARYDLRNVPDQIPCPNGMTISRAFHNEAVATDIWQAIEGYTGSALLIHGDQDLIVHPRYAIEAAQHYANLQLHIIQLMGHCSMNAEQLDNTLRLMRLYLHGKHEILDIDVVCTGAEKLHNDLSRPAPGEDLGGDFINAVYFTGTVECEAFHGAIAEGGVDRQTIRGGRMVRLCAEYTLVGTDGSGQSCEIHIVNSGIDGHFTPVIHTNSRLLAWMNDADLTAILEMRPQGPAISIWG